MSVLFHPCICFLRSSLTLLKRNWRLIFVSFLSNSVWMCDHELCGCSLCTEATFDYPPISHRCVCSDALWVDVGRSSSLWFHLQPEKEEKDDANSFQSLVSELFTGALLQDLTAIWRINSSSCCDAAASAPVFLVIDAVKSFFIKPLSLIQLIFRGTSEKRTGNSHRSTHSQSSALKL